jgi:hypothetical protein
MNMKLSKLEENVLAYFLSGDASAVRVDGKFYRRGDFLKIFEDKLFDATQPLGPRVAGRHTNVANALLDELIEKQGLSTTVDKLSGTYHQMNDVSYRQVIRDLAQSNPTCQRAAQEGATFWSDRFKP